MGDYDIDRAALDERMAEHRVKSDALSAEWALLRIEADALVDRRLDELTDDQILDDPALRDWLCRTGANYTSAYHRMHTLIDSRHFRISNCDGRDEFYGLPVPTLTLERDTELDVLAGELASWFEMWALGRKDIPLDITESTLSRHGSYDIIYRPGGTPEAKLILTRWSQEQELASGSLLVVLAYVAQHHPYSGGVDTEEEMDYG